MGWVVFIIWVVIAPAVASWIGYRVKGRSLTGFLLGIFLGWLGVLIIALLPPTAEMRVRRGVRDEVIAEEVTRRRMGADPWTAPGPPGTASS